MRIFQKEKVKKIWGREKVKLAGSWRNMQTKTKWFISLRGKVIILKKGVKKQRTDSEILSSTAWRNLKRLRKSARCRNQKLKRSAA